MTLRTQIEKIIWKHTDLLENEEVEALLDEIMPLVEGKCKCKESCPNYDGVKCTCPCHKVDNSLTKENRTVDNHPLEEGWEKEFDRIFNPDSNLFKDDDALALGITQWREAKDFFSQTLAQEKSKWEEFYEKCPQCTGLRRKVLAEVREKVENGQMRGLVAIRFIDDRNGTYYHKDDLLSLLK